jgi:hypothetical protein
MWDVKSGPKIGKGVCCGCGAYLSPPAPGAQKGWQWLCARRGAEEVKNSIKGVVRSKQVYVWWLEAAVLFYHTQM